MKHISQHIPSALARATRQAQKEKSRRWLRQIKFELDKAKQWSHRANN